MKTYNHNEFVRLRDSNFYDYFYNERTNKYGTLANFRGIM